MGSDGGGRAENVDVLHRNEGGERGHATTVPVTFVSTLLLPKLMTKYFIIKIIEGKGVA